MRRVISSELLDADLGTPREIAASLDDLWRMNRWLGGVSSSLRLVERVSARRGTRSIEILDVGAGDGRLAARLRKLLSRKGIETKFVALDYRLSHLQNGVPAVRQLRPVVADALDLPFPDEAFDVAMCNLFFHHFSGEKALRFLRSLARVARSAVLVNDVERNIIPYLFIHAARMFTRSRVTIHDAPASVRQAYTREELSVLARQAGSVNFEVCRLPLFRLGLILWKSRA